MESRQLLANIHFALISFHGWYMCNHFRLKFISFGFRVCYSCEINRRCGLRNRDRKFDFRPHQRHKWKIPLKETYLRLYRFLTLRGLHVGTNIWRINLSRWYRYCMGYIIQKAVLIGAMWTELMIVVRFIFHRLWKHVVYFTEFSPQKFIAVTWYC